MAKIRTVTVRDAEALARVLRLSRGDAIDLDLRRQLNDKIIEAARRSGLTHAQLAKAAGVSRTRLTAVLNRNRAQVSTDLLLRILAALGYRAKVTFVRTRRAA